MNVMVSFLMEVGSHMQLRNRTEFRLIASIQDVLSVQETHDIQMYLSKVEKLRRSKEMSRLTRAGIMIVVL